ncbi:Smyd3 [Symbiodinium natans]|uniref:Smyd3 protein n=1 Tax=Symbiodinium natans TaxID=878477 RepID=A0A812RHC1_9DINO|nr:Smyd3 [Symbiodinium natans]
MGLRVSHHGYGTLPDRLDAVEPFVRELFEELRTRCEEERMQYALAGQTPSPHKANFWLAHTDPERISSYVFKSRLFLQGFDDFRCGSQISKEQLRFAVLVQHFASQDTLDFQRTRTERMHDDVFEGVLTQGVNTQLMTDAHRAEWAVDGAAFVFSDSDRDVQNDEERKQALLDFRMELVTALEQFLIDFCKRRQLTEHGTLCLLQAVTTQMSQCGLANLDRCSRAGEYMVGGARLKQHVNYNISCMDAGPLGEALKLTLGCLKEGFQFIQRTVQDHADDAMGDDISTQGCDPSSRMYQCATLRFTTKLGLESPHGQDQIQCDVIDVYDEVFIKRT